MVAMGYLPMKVAGCAILTVAEFVTTLTLLTTFEVVDM